MHKKRQQHVSNNEEVINEQANDLQFRIQAQKFTLDIVRKCRLFSYCLEINTHTERSH